MDKVLGNLTLETLMSHTPLAFAVSDASGNLAMLSPALERLLGRPFRPLGDEDWAHAYDLYAADGLTPLPPEKVPLARAVRGEVITDAIIATLRDDGYLAYLRCNASPVRNESDTIVGAVVLIQDVTAERTAHEAQAHLRSQLVETINHQIRTPLTKIVGHAELLQDHQDDLPAPLRTSVGAIAAGATALFKLAEVISGLAELEAQTHLTTTYCDVAELVRDLVETYQYDAGARGVLLTCDSGDHAQGNIDPGRTRKAVAALLDNALTHAPRGSGVEVSILSGQTWIEIAVRDHGPGIDPTDWPRLLKPFERGTTEVASSSGRGMGLTIAETVAAAHGGEVLLEVPQPSEGCGTRVRLRLATLPIYKNHL